MLKSNQNKIFKNVDIDKILKEKNPGIKDLEYIYGQDFLNNYKNIKLNKSLLPCVCWRIENQQLLKKIANNYFQKIKKYNIIDHKLKTMIHHHIILQQHLKNERKVRKI